jgi:hypothetical protein
VLDKYEQDSQWTVPKGSEPRTVKVAAQDDVADSANAAAAKVLITIFIVSPPQRKVVYHVYVTVAERFEQEKRGFPWPKSRRNQGKQAVQTLCFMPWQQQSKDLTATIGHLETIIRASLKCRHALCLTTNHEGLTEP